MEVASDGGYAESGGNPERRWVERIAAETEYAGIVEVGNRTREFVEMIVVSVESSKLGQVGDVGGQGGKAATGDVEIGDFGAVVGEGLNRSDRDF